MRTNREAIREILESATTSHMADVAKRALRAGDERSLIRALVEARESGITTHVVQIANAQLGFRNKE